MRRTEARELLMQMLFHMEAQTDYSQSMKQTFIDANETYYTPDEYFDKTYEIIRDHLSEIDSSIDQSSEHWKVSRMAKVDLAVLRISVAELLFVDEVPDSVSINEAVDLAKKFGTDDSSKFVNGVLGKIARGKDGEQ